MIQNVLVANGIFCSSEKNGMVGTFQKKPCTIVRIKFVLSVIGFRVTRWFDFIPTIVSKNVNSNEIHHKISSLFIVQINNEKWFKERFALKTKMPI